MTTAGSFRLRFGLRFCGALSASIALSVAVLGASGCANSDTIEGTSGSGSGAGGAPSGSTGAFATSSTATTSGAGGTMSGTGGMSSSSSSSSSSGTGGMSSSSSTTTGGGSTDPCDGFPNGSYCGGQLGGLADHSSVYVCSGGTTQSVQSCSNGCNGGTCVKPPADPCASATSGNGYYCGGSLNGGDPNSLYNCQSGTTASKQTCPAGCQVNPPGVPDACKSTTSNPCMNATSGNGPYCGSSISGDPNVLYNCQNGQVASQQTCTAGCQINPPGTADACKATGGGTCCVNKPPGVLTQSYSACGGGGSHYGVDYGTPTGTPIYAGISGTVVGSATGYPNCYNNGCTSQCWNSFNYVKIKSDCGDPSNPSTKDLYVYYLHINGLASGISNGTHVNQGQLLAYSGNSGCSSGPHIHIETVSVNKGASASLNTCNSVNPTTRYCN